MGESKKVFKNTWFLSADGIAKIEVSYYFLVFSGKLKEDNFFFFRLNSFPILKKKNTKHFQLNF
ncbi:MAG: hypothetical protein CMH15_03440 [Mesonia sp.]|nr:hypothetical protein [Mesonia sp.]MAQ40093.1 hypothetical protein [Mesonia sp.]MAQ40098.1 hypothetical protein [Mesonia sp.]MBJ96605.1 hypothetical protein [Flavobacteriaceae bacterium]